MKVSVLLFASAAEAVGRSQMEVEVSGESSLSAVVEALIALHGEAEPVLSKCALALNEQYAGRETRLSQGDVVAFIPPVSGG